MLVTVCKCWTVSLVKISNLTCLIETKLIKHQSVYTLSCPPLLQCWFCPLYFWASFTTTCWDFVCLKLMQVRCVLSLLLWVLRHNHFVVFRKHWFSVVIHHLLSSFHSFGKDPWALGGRGIYTDVPFRAEYFKVSYSLPWSIVGLFYSDDGRKIYQSKCMNMLLSFGLFSTMSMYKSDRSRFSLRACGLFSAWF